MSDTEHVPGADPETGAWTSAQIDTSVAHPARVYNYLLGGKDNYEVDQRAAEAMLALVPNARLAAQASRAFLGRAVRYLAQAGIRQFLGIGTGIPGPGNTNDVAREIAPDARIPYVDNDPIVITHSRVLLCGRDANRTAVIHADVRDPGSILEHPRLRAVLDLSQPVAVLLLSVFHFIADEADPQGIVERF